MRSVYILVLITVISGTAFADYCEVAGGSTAYEMITSLEYEIYPDPYEPESLRVTADVFITNPGGCKYGKPCPSYDPYPEIVSVWIDWDGDEYFQPDEMIMHDSLTGYRDINYWGTMVASEMVTIPEDAVNETLMRAHVAWKHDPVDPCEQRWVYGNSVDKVVQIRRPDLRVKNITLYATDPSQPRMLDLMHVKIENKGQIKAKDVVVEVKQKLSTLSGAVTLDTHTESFSELAPKEVETIVLEGDFDPSDISVIEAKVDPGDKIEESVESNNLRATHRISGKATESGTGASKPLKHAKVVLYQQEDGAWTPRWVTFTDLGGNYNIWSDVATIDEGKPTKVNVSLDYSPLRDPFDVKISVIHDSSWGSSIAPSGSAKAIDKGVVVDGSLGGKDYPGMDVSFSEGGAAYQVITQAYSYFKKSPTYYELPRRLKVEIMDDDYSRNTSYMDSKGTFTLHMWHEHCKDDTTLRDIMVHEYAHAVSSPWNMPYGPTRKNNVRRENGLDENWANYGSCLARNDWRSTVYTGNFVNYQSAFINMTVFYMDRGGTRRSLDYWSWAMGDVWVDLDSSQGENKVVYTLKYGQPKRVKDFYLAYQAVFGDITDPRVKNMFIAHGFSNATAWMPNGTDPKYFPGGYIDNPVDHDSDGDFDKHSIAMDVNVTEPGDYYIYGFLKDATREGYCYAVRRVSLSPGISQQSLDFDGACISGNRLAGELELTGLYIADQSLEQLDYRQSIYNTSAVDYLDYDGGIKLVGFQDNAIDEDTDGDYDLLSVNASLLVEVEDRYFVSASLYDSSGHWIDDYQTDIELSSGQNTVPLAFDGDSIYHHGADGPYSVKGLSVTLPELTLKGQTLISDPKSYETAVYDYMDFQPPAARFMDVTYHAQDTDGNGIFESVEVNASIESDVSGVYLVRGTLSNTTVGISDYKNTTYLGPGISDVTLSFDGVTLRRNSIDGPYLVELELERTSQDSSLIGTADVTLPFTADDFEIPPEGDYLLNWSDEAIDTDSDGLYDYLKISQTGEGLEFRALLYSQDRELISVAHGQEPMFGSQDIYASGIDGPYVVDVIVYENGSEAARIYDAVLTVAYDADDFEGIRIADVSDFAVVRTDLGQFNYLGVTAALESNIGAEATITAEIYGEEKITDSVYAWRTLSGRKETPSSNHSVNISGSGEIKAYFRGYEIYKSVSDGNYDVLIDLHVNGTVVHKKRYETGNYDRDDFEHLVSFRGFEDDHGLDLDSDGVFDYLAVDIGVDLEQAGYLGLNAVLHDGDGEIVTRSEGKFWAPAGNSTMSLFFNGTEIRDHVFSGNFSVGYLYLYHTGDPDLDVYVGDHYQTSYYAYDSFNHSGMLPNVQPVASVNGPYGGSSGDTISFNSSGSYDPDGDELSYSWDLGDGTVSDEADPSHLYAQEGIYNVSLTVNDGKADSVPSITTASIGYPTADAGGPYFAGVGQEIAFNGTGSFDPDGDALDYDWDFGDGTSGSGQAPSHTYNSTGKYTVRLTVDDGSHDSLPSTALVTVEKVTFFEKIISYVEDLDGDGLYDTLVVETNVTTYLERDVELSVELRDSSGNLIQQGSMTHHLTRGHHNLVIAYNGTAVYDNGEDGPYHAYYVLEQLNSTMLDYKNHTTLPYDHEDFEHVVKGYYTVDDDGSHVPFPPADFSSIQEAVDNVPEGSEIRVYYGEYAENLVIGRTVSLQGIQRPVIDAMWYGHAINLTANGCNVSGFRIRNSFSGGEMGGLSGSIVVTGGGNSISGNIIEDSDTGMNILSDDNKVYGNSLSGLEDGFLIQGSSDNQIEDNNLSSIEGTGIRIINSTENTIVGNLIRDCSEYGMMLEGSDHNMLTMNILENGLNAWDGGDNSWNSSKREYEYGGEYFENHTGNFWSDHQGLDAGSDGIYDGAHDFQASSDLYPMVPDWPGGFRPLALASESYTSESGAVIVFDGSDSYDPEGESLEYYWDLGDGESAEGMVVNHSYPVAGRYTVTLVVSDSYQNSTPYRAAALIDYPIADVGGPYYGFEGQMLRLNGTGSYDPQGRTITGYYWDFGDGTPYMYGGSGPMPYHSYDSAGNYSVSLYITVPGFSIFYPIYSAEDYTYAYVEDSKPVANFSVDETNGIAPLEVSFTDLSSSYDGIVSYEWDLDGDGSVDLSGEPDPVYTYSTAGQYSPMLIVHEGDGDSDNVSFPGLIHVQGARPPKTIYVPDDFANIQPAIDDPDTIDGDTIVLGDGIYDESIEVHKALAIIGGGKDDCILRPAGNGNVINVTADDVTIRGCTITGAYYHAAGIYLVGVNGTNITGNNISDNARGIMSEHSALFSVSANTFVGNTDAAVQVYGSSAYNPGVGIEIRDNDIYLNKHMGIYFRGVGNSRVIGNDVYGNNGSGMYILGDSNEIMGNSANQNQGQGILVRGAYNNITGNTADNNTYHGLELSSPEIYLSIGNRVWNNRFRENHRYDLFLGNGAGLDANNLFMGNIGSGDRPICVFNDTVKLNDTVCSELILYKADYSEILNVTVKGSDHIKNNAVFLYDTHHSNLTAVRSSGNYYGLRFMGYRYPSPAVVYHWANNSIIDSEFTKNYYDGVDIVGKGNLVEGCDISSNGRVSPGGIIYGDGIEVAGHYNMIRSNIMHNNTAYAIRFGVSGNPYLAFHNEFVGNSITSNRGGIYAMESDYNQVRDNLISGSAKDGIQLTSSSHWLISGNDFHDNALDGIYTLYARNITVSGNAFDNNKVGCEAASSDAYIGDSGFNLSGNLFTNNTEGVLFIGRYGLRSENHVFDDNEISGNDVGVHIQWETRDIRMSGNSFDRNRIGLLVSEFPDALERGTALCSTGPCEYLYPSDLDVSGNWFNDTVFFNSTTADDPGWLPADPVHVRLLSPSSFSDNTFHNTTASFVYNGTGALSISPVHSPSEAPEGHVSLGRNLDIKNHSIAAGLLVNISYEPDDVAGLNESAVQAMLDSPWHHEPVNGERLDIQADVLSYDMAVFGVLGLFARKPGEGNSPPYFTHEVTDYTLYLIPPKDIMLANDISGSMSADYMEINYTRYYGYMLYDVMPLHLSPGETELVHAMLNSSLVYDDVGVTVRGDECLGFYVSPPGEGYSMRYQGEELYHFDADDGFHDASAPGGSWSVMVDSQDCGHTVDVDVELYISLIDSLKLSGMRYVQENLVSAQRVGIVDFATSAVAGVLPTDDETTLYQHISQYDATGDTCICCAIDEIAANVDPGSDVLLLTDGEALKGCIEQGVTGDLNFNGRTNDPGDDAIQAACDAYADHGITINAVGFSDRVDMTTLIEIAECSGGDFYYARDHEELDTLVSSLAPSLGPVSLSLDFNCSDDDGDDIIYHFDSMEIDEGILELSFNSSTEEIHSVSCSDGEHNTSRTFEVVVI